MKKIIILLLFIFLLVSCKNDEIERLEVEYIDQVIVQQYDNINTKNIKVYGYFNKKDKIEITEKVSFIANTNVIGEHEGQVVYGEIKTTFIYTVVLREPEPTIYYYEMYLTLDNVKRDYKLNEELDLTNLEIKIRDNFDTYYYPKLEECNFEIYYGSNKVNGFTEPGNYDITVLYTINNQVVKQTFGVFVGNEQIEILRLNVDSFKMTYELNEQVEIENLQLCRYSVGDKTELLEIIHDYDWSLEFNNKSVNKLDKCGTYKLIVKYEHLGDFSFNEYVYINVVESLNDKLDVDTKDVNLVYYIGERFDKNGLKVTFNNEEININECTISVMYNDVVHEQFQHAGFYNVLVEYLDSSFTFEILVLDKTSKSVVVTPKVEVLSSQIVSIEIPNIIDSLYEYNVNITIDDCEFYSLYFFEEKVYDLPNENKCKLSGTYQAYIDEVLYTFVIMETTFEVK